MVTLDREPRPLENGFRSGPDITIRKILAGTGKGLHTLDLLQGHFERVVALRAGRVFWQGAPEQITQPLLRELYGAEYRALHLDEIEVPA